MADLNQILSVIYEAIDDLNPSLSAGKLEKAPTTTLFGKGSVLTSVELVNLIVTVEQIIEDQLGVALTLADEKAMSQRESPFRSVQTLADYALNRVNQAPPRG